MTSTVKLTDYLSECCGAELEREESDSTAPRIICVSCRKNCLVKPRDLSISVSDDLKMVDKPSL